MAVVETF